MMFNFENLDNITRKLMEEEVNYDIQSKKIYISSRLNDFGKLNYTKLLKSAINEGNCYSLANELRNQNCIKTKEERKTKNGLHLVNVPVTAHETLAEGEFNRYYIRALCIRVITDKIGVLEIYRAKEVSNSRTESQMKIGNIINPEKILLDLRENIGVDTAFGLPSGPNSGLSIRIKS